MNEHTQKLGVRKWAGDDLVELQKEGLDALQALVEPYAPCIIQGCEVRRNGEENTYTVSPGFVALKGNLAKESAVDEERQGVKIVRFEGMGKATLPLYLGLGCETENRPYLDGVNKPVKYRYVAEKLLEQSPDCLTLTGDNAAPRLVDTLGITQKLDRIGGDASQTKVEFLTTDAEELKSGNPLSKLFGAIKKCLTSITTKLDGIEVGANKYIHPTDAGNKHIPSGGSSGQYLKYDSAGTAAWATPGSNTATTSAAGFMSATDKAKLDGIATGANAYTHPTTAGNKHIPTGGSSGQYLKYSASGTATWNKPTASEIGAAAASHSHDAATQSAAGFMSAADKKKLDGIATGANNYTHPTTAGNKHIPTGGSSGQYLKYSASGTAVWNKPTASEIGAATSGHTHTPGSIGAAAASHSHTAATKSSAGFMSAADKSDFDKMAKCKIVGAYIIGTDDNPIIAQYGYKITMSKVTYNGEKGYRFTLSTANGFSSSKEFVYLCIAFGGYQHTADVYGAFVYGGDTNYLFHRKLDGVPEYSGLPVRMFIIECN